MALSSKAIVDKINSALSSATSATDVATLTAAKKVIEGASFSVPDLASLPPAADNMGRIVWVVASNDYRYSDGVNWIRDFDSNKHVLTATIWSWGDSVAGRLGDNTTVNKSSPVSVVGGFTDWCQVSAGSYHTTAIRTNGTAWAWGLNTYGRLGDCTSVSKLSPVSVVGGFTDWCQVSSGVSFTSAIRTNGTLWSWGRNQYGQLGDNTTVNKSSPVSVVGGFTDWCQVSVSFIHTAALRTNGTLWSWGGNQYGQLGDNTIANKSSPVSVVGGFTDWCQVSSGNYHTAALRTNGTLWSWGNNARGQLGDNTNTSKSSPVSVVGGFTDWCQVSSGGKNSAAVRTNGTLWAWGDSFFGQLGDNTTNNKSSPVSVVGGFTDWCQVSAGYASMSGIRTNSTLWTWGWNVSGKLGDNTTVNKSSPVSVVGGFSDWCQVSAGGRHIVALNINNRGF